MRSLIGTIGIGVLVLSPGPALAQERKAEAPGPDPEARQFERFRLAIIRATPVIDFPEVEDEKLEELRARILQAVPKIDEPPRPMPARPPGAPAVAVPAGRVRAAVRVVAPAQVQVDVNQLIAVYSGQFRPQLTAELNFVRTVCRPTAEQYRQIRLKAEGALKDVARAFAEWQRDLRSGKGRAMTLNPNRAVGEAVSRTIEACLTPEQASHYRAELAARAEDQKQTAIRNMVADLDRELILSTEQRARICKALSDDWDESWRTSLDAYAYNSDALHIVPEQCFFPHLTPAQIETWRERWRTRQNVDVLVNRVLPLQGVPLEEEEPAPAEAGGK